MDQIHIIQEVAAAEHMEPPAAEPEEPEELVAVAVGELAV